MKILIAIFIRVCMLDCINSLKEKRFKKERFESISDLLSNSLVAREMTPLRGQPKARCAFACTKFEGCQAFVREHERCILLGNATLPGEDVTMQTDEPTDVYGN